MKKLFAIILACFMIFALVACSGGSKDNGDSQDETEEVKVLKMGSSADFPPYEYYEGDEIVGIDAEIAAAVCEKLGYQLEINDMIFDSIITAVKQGKVDFGMSGFTVTEDRLLEIDFTIPYTTSKQVIVVPEDSEIQSVDDLFADGATYKVGVQTNTTGDIYISDDVDTLGLSLEVMQFTKATDAIIALTSGKVDCFIIDDQVGKAFCAANDGIKVLETEYVVEEYAVVFPKESELYDDFNTALQELIDDGTVQQIIDKYITE